jgi:hypothetical protein
MLTLALVAPLLIKVSNTGFVPPEWARSERCEVGESKVILTRTYSFKKIQYQFPFETEENTIEDMIEKARHEKLVFQDNHLCDGPSTLIKAGDDLLLYSTGGCGSPKKIRQGPYSLALRDIASTFCPTTH